MKKITFKIKDLHLLKSIKSTLYDEVQLSDEQQAVLTNLCDEIPEIDGLLREQISLDVPIEINFLNMTTFEKNLERWRLLFTNIPGYDSAPFCFIVIEEEVTGEELQHLLKKSILMVAYFFPTATCARSEDDRNPFEVHLKTDGLATFLLPTLQGAETYPELYNFNGTWKDAYLLMIETVKKGWPMEEFPKELQKFLPM